MFSATISAGAGLTDRLCGRVYSLVTVDRGKNSGSSDTGPRRLMKVMFSPPGAGRTPRRSGAGDESWAAEIGRIRKNSVSPDWAARCNLLNDSARICGAQYSKAPTPLLSTCSQAQFASELVLLLSQTNFVGSNPNWAKPIGFAGYVAAAT